MLFVKRILIIISLCGLVFVSSFSYAAVNTKTINSASTSATVHSTASLSNSSSFIVGHIEVKGLQGISLGTVLSYLPVKEGDRITIAETSNIIKALYKTGFFNDVELVRKGSTLIITVVERPIIGKINISGNKKITTKQLLDALKSSGFSEGQAFDSAILSGIKQSLIQQYYNYGRYNVDVTTTITKEPRNRVSVSINISEGPEAKIKAINILGNQVFTQKELLKNFSLKTSSIFTWFSSADQYSKEKLDADLESLRSFYLDHGYLRFNVDSTQVSITPDKKKIYIVIHVSEGKAYKVKGFDLSGNLIDQKSAIAKLITLKVGDTFSRKVVMDINSSINKFLGDFGYAYPDIQSNPVLDDKNATVFLHFKINPGKKVYIRRITFSGNNKTSEEVLRRELRQQEGGLFSYSKVKESTRRLNNLGYLQNVQSKLQPVANHPGQADLDYSVKEVSSAQASLQVGYSDIDKFVYGAGVNDSNFLGSGKTVGVQFQNSAYQQLYSVSYLNPYHTINNVSLGIDAYYRKTTPDSINLSSYTSDNFGGAVTYGFPLSDYNRISLGYGFDHIKLNTADKTPTQIQDFVKQYGNRFDTAKLTGGWSYNNLDRAIFPTQGFANLFGAEVSAPVFKNAIKYYKLTYTAAYYYPFVRGFGLHLRGDLGYGDGYGKYKTLPFFKNFYAGGMDSVRGFSGATLGPLDSNGAPLGGNVLGDASFGVIFPNPFGESLRTTAFVDTGNVYQNKFSFRDLRSSVGLAVEWRSPLGILSFALAKPIAHHTGDNENFFDFTIGASL